METPVKFLLFRDHRGGYDASMLTKVKISSLAELEAHVKKLGYVLPLSEKQYGKDPRNNWDTYLIEARMHTATARIKDEFPVGFLSGSMHTLKKE